MTYAYAILHVSQATYDEIPQKLDAAGYQHAFHKDGEAETIDMHGIGLAVDRAPDPNIEDRS